MIAPCYTEDKDQTDRCVRACQAGTTITETFVGGIKVTGRVQSVVENLVLASGKYQTKRGGLRAGVGHRQRQHPLLQQLELL
jgi:hypothetical protein